MDDSTMILTARADLQLAVERWCGAVGVPVRAIASLAEARRFWKSAPACVVGEDLAPQLAAAQWARREHVYVVADDPEQWWRHAVGLGASNVLGTHDDSNAVATLTRIVDGGAEGCSIAVVGGRGGVGATTLACSLGLVAAGRAVSPVVIDADPVGPGVDVVLGTESTEGLRWRSLDTASGLIAPTALAAALPRRDGVSSLGWDPIDELPALPPGAVSVWEAATRGFDLVVVDQPRGVVDDSWSVSVLGGSVLTVVVVADDVPAVASARRQVAWLRERAPAVAAVMARHRGGLGRSTLEAALGVPIVGAVGRDRRVRSHVDVGSGPKRSRRWNRVSRDVLDLVGLAATR